jgi:hypothetical protein
VSPCWILIVQGPVKLTSSSCGSSSKAGAFKEVRTGGRATACRPSLCAESRCCYECKRGCWELVP